MKIYKIDFEASREIYQECKDSIDMKMCYNNVANCMGGVLS